ncbi:MAG: hypothetical protein QG564_505 [Campylobacterota bacterium]|nr:hypothetical protein [Campylobacterota bacterium]
MKKLIFIFLGIIVCTYADLSVKQIEEMVVKIHEKREGVKLETLETTKEPFVALTNENNMTTFAVPQEAEEAKLSLHGIMNGKAYINEGWMNVGDNVMGYTLKYVGKKGVVLRNANQIKKLFLHKKRDDFIMVEGR